MAAMTAPAGCSRIKSVILSHRTLAPEALFGRVRHCTALRRWPGRWRRCAGRRGHQEPVAACCMMHSTSMCTAWLETHAPPLPPLRGFRTGIEGTKCMACRNIRRSPAWHSGLSKITTMAFRAVEYHQHGIQGFRRTKRTRNLLPHDV